jgi:DNA-binding PadR family transcriptional regulator
MAQTAQLILGLMEEDSPAHGYGLKQRHDHHFRRARPLHVGQIYSTLGRLERDGLVRPAGVESEAGPERKLYEITGEGRRSTDAWLTSPEAPSDHLQPVLFAKVVLALLTDRDPFEYLDAQRATHLARMRELTALKRSGGLSDKLLADHALFHLEADLRWIDLAAARIDDLAAEVVA